MKILITGTAGFIGYSFSKYLLSNTKYKIIGIDNLNDYYSTKIKIARIKNLFISKPNKKSVRSIGVPNLANTAPKKFDAATNTIINAEISKVLTKASCNFLNVNF